MKTHESEEMYLETILVLLNRKGTVRSVDVVEELDYAKSSVSRGVNLLAQKGYITLDKNNDIHFTAEGLERAREIYDRHQVLTKALEVLGADRALAEDNACRIEHVMTEEMFEIIKEFVNKQEQAK